MNIGLMGGTFDPIHMGHLIAAEQAWQGMKLDEIWFIPVFQPPHKSAKPLASPEERLEMVRIATRDHEAFRINDIEINRGGPSYTLDTVNQLKALHPDDTFYHIIGADMVQYLPEWNRIDELLDVISFIGLERPGHKMDWSMLGSRIREAVHLVPMPQFDVSSTEIRNRRRQGQSIRYLVPEGVRRFIEEKRLSE